MTTTLLSRLRYPFSAPSIAIDLGTANTRIHANGQLIEKRTVVRHDRKPISPDETTLSGDPSVRFPLRRGVVVDVDAAAELLTPLVAGARGMALRRPRAVACLPATASAEQREALVSAIHAAGVGAVAIAPEPLAAAIGAGVDLWSEGARLVVDIGDGITELAVIRAAQMIRSASIPVACSDLRSAVRLLLRNRHGILVHESEADSLLRLVAGGTSGDLTLRRSRRGGNSQIRIPSEGLLEAVTEAAEPIVSFLDTTLRALPDRSSAEVIESGLWLTGGGAALDVVVRMIEKRTLLDVRKPANPLLSTIEGVRQMVAAAGSTEMAWH